MKCGKLIIIDDELWVYPKIARKPNCWCPKIRVPPNQAFRCELFCQKSRLSRPPEALIFGKILRFSQNPEAPIFRKICHFRKFLNRQISVKIRDFVRNFRKILDFWHNYTMHWINSGYKYRVSDRGAHFFDRRPVLCNNNIIIIYKKLRINFKINFHLKML